MICISDIHLIYPSKAVATCAATEFINSEKTNSTDEFTLSQRSYFLCTDVSRRYKKRDSGMKGVVFNLLEEMVEQNFGIAVWDSLLEATNQDGIYVSCLLYTSPSPRD